MRGFVRSASFKAKSALEAAAGNYKPEFIARPLVRVTLFNLGVDKTSRLLLVIHHLVVDGVSWRILVEDLQNLPATRRGEAIKLPSKRPRSSSGQSNCGVCVSGGAARVGLLVGRTLNMFPICQWTILGANTVASARIMSVTLSVAETKVPATGGASLTPKSTMCC